MIVPTLPEKALEGIPVDPEPKVLPLPLPELEHVPVSTHSDDEDDADFELGRLLRKRKQRTRTKQVLTLSVFGVLAVVFFFGARMMVQRVSESGTFGSIDGRRIMDQSGIEAVRKDLKTKPNIEVHPGGAMGGNSVMVEITFPDGYKSLLSIEEMRTVEEAISSRNTWRQLLVGQMRESRPTMSVDEMKYAVSKIAKSSGKYLVREWESAGKGGEGIEYLERYYILD